MKILVVEDATKLARFVARVLTEEGYAVDLCGDGVDAIEQARTGSYDLVILDWMLPGADGLSVCRELRKLGCTLPILMLTARGDTGDKVLALDAGADDFVAKPFEVEELLARVRAHLRRSSGFVELRCGPLRIDRLNNSVAVEGAKVDLTSREYALLLHLAHNADRIVKRTDLLQHVWQTQFESGSNVIDVQVSRLREKLGAHSHLIETVRGIGYRLRTSPS
jgi:DNA-binding response OmpR family regulator